LLINSLGYNETHLWLVGCYDNRLRISRIIFLMRYERANVLWRVSAVSIPLILRFR
jgi:hypothetical protein